MGKNHWANVSDALRGRRIADGDDTAAVAEATTEIRAALMRKYPAFRFAGVARAVHKFRVTVAWKTFGSKDIVLKDENNKTLIIL